MNTNELTYTQELQKAIEIATLIAKENSNKFYSSAHFLKAILNRDLSLLKQLESMGIDVFFLLEWADVRIEEMPKSSQVFSPVPDEAITIHITDEESGKVRIKNPDLNNEHSETIELPTYKMLVTDTLTDEKHTYEVIRDFIISKKENRKEKKSFWSFLNFDFIKPKNYRYDILSYEPEYQEIETYIISKYRKLNHDILSYSFSKNDKILSLFAGDYDDFVKPENQESLFIVVDGQKGQRFIGDILYREKFLKLTPVVELKIIKRKNSPKSVEFDKKGNINRIVYI